MLFSLLLCDKRRLSIDGSCFDRFDDEASGLFDLCSWLRSPHEARISSFFRSSMRQAAVGESRLSVAAGEIFRADAGEPRGLLWLLHNISFSSHFVGSRCVS